MNVNMMWLVGAVAAGALLGVETAAAATGGPPALVTAYAEQLARQCGPLPPGDSAVGLVQRIDLNGDKVDDWIVDASRYPCPGRPVVAASTGEQLTIFRGMKDGIAIPALQRATFGAAIRKAADGSQALWLLLGGADCGAGATSVRCERKVVWRPAEGRFDAVAVAPGQTAAR